MAISDSEESLKAAVEAVDRRYVDGLPSDDEIDYVFSKRFERRMNKLIAQYNCQKKNKKSHVARKRWIAILAAVIMAISTVMSVSAAREAVFQFVSQVYEKYSQIFFSQSLSVSRNHVDFTEHEPIYIPSGFQLVRSESNGFLCLEYKKDDDMISYLQQDANNIVMRINTEGETLEELEVNGHFAKYYSNDGIQNIIWYDDQYMYMVSSTLDGKTVLKIAESVLEK